MLDINMERMLRVSHDRCFSSLTKSASKMCGGVMLSSVQILFKYIDQKLNFIFKTLLLAVSAGVVLQNMFSILTAFQYNLKFHIW